ncbi:hypothetical protein BCV71DRAFT_261733 [Rhizopus microsporus]|uniref:Uncharacterized protein n=1 Tax=Rhizopus microsporus TaxID=58291 RepID=A0A1X0S958_RHIZD|nr:hypothetical protein BCV71DRAFT_261733 [Rhizopus microsporus]
MNIAYDNYSTPHFTTSYFQSTTDPTLTDFVETHEQIIVAYYVKGENLAFVWPTIYGKAQAFYYRNILKCKPPKVNTKNVDFGKAPENRPMPQALPWGAAYVVTIRLYTTKVSA